MDYPDNGAVYQYTRISVGRVPLNLEVPNLGWKQFLTARRKMLSRFDEAREKARGHKVQTFHGRVAEGLVREWLTEFLPKRWGVTSGYIVSPGISSVGKLPHFDVIIYDQLEAPILWIDETPDGSNLGQSRAVPAEYVRCVLEVKSALSATTAHEAMEHLNELKALLEFDHPDDKYKLHLHSGFFCGVIFFELRTEDRFSSTALVRMVNGLNLRGYFGGFVLRANTDKAQECTGRITFVSSPSPRTSSFDQRTESSLFSGGFSDSCEVTPGSHIWSLLMWSETYFSQFAFDLLARLKEEYEEGRLSSFLAFGTSELER
jgi:hypothetical protein